MHPDPAPNRIADGTGKRSQSAGDPHRGTVAGQLPTFLARLHGARPMVALGAAGYSAIFMGQACIGYMDTLPVER
jgi:predicted O-methyltransferase YrrM